MPSARAPGAPGPSAGAGCRAPLAVGLVRRSIGSWRNVGSGRSKATDDVVGLVVAQQVDQHRREAEHRVGDLARRRRHVGRQGEERPVGQRVAVEQQQLGHGSSVRRRPAPATQGTRLAVDDLLGDRLHRACGSRIAVFWMKRERVAARSARARPSAGPWPGRRSCGSRAAPRGVGVLVEQRPHLAGSGRARPRWPASARSSGTA